LLDNVGADAAAERDAAVFRPGRMSALRSRLAALRPRPVPLSAALLAGVFDEEGELAAKCGGVRGVQVDLVPGVAEPESHRLIGRAAIKIVF
jgi:hypothetical protein